MNQRQSRGPDKNVSPSKRGRIDLEEWQDRTRYVLNHIDDPIALQRSQICRLTGLEKLARTRFPNGVVAYGRTLQNLVIESLEEIEKELDGNAGVLKLAKYVNLTRQGKNAKEASESAGVSASYASRAYKRTLVELLTNKLLIKLNNNQN